MYRNELHLGAYGNVEFNGIPDMVIPEGSTWIETDTGSCVYILIFSSDDRLKYSS